MAWCMFSFGLIFAQSNTGGNALSLQEIDALIAQTDYNTALAELSVYMEQNPKDFDAAQKRVNKIIKARRDYSELATQLLDVLANDISDQRSERVLALCTQLESLEKYPTEKNLQFIKKAKSAAQYNVYYAKFNQLMTDGANLVRAEKYVDGANTFRQGFVLYREEFDEMHYPASVTDSVHRAVDELNAAPAQMQRLMDACQIATNDFIKAVKKEDVSASRAAFARVQASFAQYAQLRNKVAAAGHTFKAQFAALQAQDSTLSEVSFLGLAQRFALGRASDPDSGILGAFDAYWNSKVEPMKAAVYDTVHATLARAVVFEEESLFKSGAKFDAQQTNGGRAAEFAAIGGDVQQLYALLQNGDGTRVSDIYHGYADSMQFAQTMAHDVIASASATRTLLSEADVVSQRKTPESFATESAFDAFAGTQLASVRVYETLVSQTRTTAQLLSSERAREQRADAAAQEEQERLALLGEEAKRTTAGVSVSDAPLVFADVIPPYEKINQKIADAAQTYAGGLWSELALLCGGEGQRRLAACTTRLEAAQKQYDGITTDDEEIAKKYPAEAMAAAQKLNEDIAKQKTQLVAYRTTLSDGEPYRATEQGYNQGMNQLDAAIAALDPITLNGNVLIANAKTQLQKAERATNEAKLRYNEAVAALKNGRFEDARNALQRARTKYNESLSYQESDALRAASDEQLAALGADIAAKENEIVVREVRELKNRAKNAYYAGNFEEAETRLTQAKTRWATTNVDDDQEITNLLAMVTTALSMKTGRVIPPTAPLYPEMSQILSIANQYYDDGAVLMKQGKRAEAETVLNLAKEKLRNLQLVYPLNQEASLLTLRIDQLIDAESFTAMFARKVTNARTDYKNPAKRQQAYTDLLDLYEINPSYPGLKQLIYDVEIEIGVRQKPVDNSALVMSKSLSDQAQKIYASAGRNEERLRSALSLLDQAIELNPNNDAAMLLKDRIQTTIGGKAAVVLSSADEAMYQKAIQELQKNNIVTANALVEQLLQKQTNRRSAKVLDLQKRVKALL